MRGALPSIVVALPFAAAAALSVVGSWRIGVWINAGSATLLFLLACLLPWHLHLTSSPLRVGVTETHLVLLTSFVAMTTGWYSRREIPDFLAARSLNRRRVQVYHVACQGLIGAILLALLSDSPALTWLALTIAVAAAAAVTGAVDGTAATAAASRLLMLCGVGLMLALFGTLLLYLAAAARGGGVLHIACIFLLLGYGALSGLVPLHAWLPGAASEGPAPGAIIVATLMVNAPLILFMRLITVVVPNSGLPGAMLMALGLVTLLLGACCLLAQSDTRRTVAFAGMAQIGIVAFAIGLGGSAATSIAVLLVTLLALARASVLQCQDAAVSQMSAVTRIAGMLVLALLPLFALFLLAGPAVDRSPWLLLPLGAGVLLTSSALLAQLPGQTSLQSAGTVAETIVLVPIWAQLGVVLLLAFAMPGPLADWFGAMVPAR